MYFDVVRKNINDNKLPCPHQNCRSTVVFFEKHGGLESHYRQVHKGEKEVSLQKNAQKFCEQLLFKELCAEFYNLDQQKQKVSFFLSLFFATCLKFCFNTVLFLK